MKNIYSLFLASIISLNVSAQNTTVLTGNSGTFGVTGSQYIDNMHEAFDIQVEAGNRIKLTIDHDLEECCDKIYLYESGENGGASLLAQTISTYGQHQYVSLGNRIIVEFRSDGSVNYNSGYNGFSVNYTVTGDPSTLGNILQASAIVSGHSDKPNLIVAEPKYKYMNGSANNRVNFDNSTLLVNTGYYQLGFGERTIASSSSLYLKSAYSMYFNSSGNYYFNTPSNTFPFKIYSTGKIALNNSTHTKALINGKLQGTDWEHIIDFRNADNTRSYVIGNGGGSGFMPTITTTTNDTKAALYLNANHNAASTGNRGIITFDGRRNGGTAPLDQVIIEYCSGYGNRLAHIMGDGTFHTKGDIQAKGTVYANEVQVKDMSASNLKLNGNLFANKILLKANDNTADFVFEPDYQLRDLSEVESFIAQNKHLPDIPSAAEMEAQGVNLAEMNKLLLQKVEELTLYAIELEKEMEQVRIEESESQQKHENLEDRLAKLEGMLTKLLQDGK